MTISSTSRVAGPFSGTGSVGTFAFAFKVFAPGDLSVVLLNLATGAIALPALTADYTVSLNADQDTMPGGSITLASGSTTAGLTGGVLASGYTLTITTAMAELQGVDLTNGGAFYPNVINTALDTLTILIQQNSMALQRTITFPVTDGNPPSFSTTLPPATARAGLMLGFDSTGKLATYNSVPQPGPPNVLAVGTVTTGAAGSAAATITGASPSQTLNLTIPQGATGPQGLTGPQGAQGMTGATGATGSAGATGPAGPSGATLNYRGAWSSTTTYNLNDAVSVSNVLYASLQGSNLNQNPTTATAYWAVFPSPTLSTATPLVASGSGSAGNGATAAAGNHVHPSEVAGLAIAPLSVATGGVAIEQSAPALNPQGYARYFCDSVGNIWLCCDMNGKGFFPIGLKTNTLTVTGAVSFGLAPDFASLQINDEQVLALSLPASRWMGSSQTVTDSVGTVSSSVLPTGELFAPQGVKGKYLAHCCVDADGMVYWSALDGATGLLQLFKSDPLNGSVWKLTGTGNNYAPQVSSDGTKLSFISDRNGSEQVFLGDLWAVVKVLAGVDVRSLFQYNHVCVTGQSLSIGYATNALTTTQPYSNLTFNNGPRCQTTGGGTVPGSALTALIPLVEVTDADQVSSSINDGETICSGMLNRISQDFMPQGLLFTGIGSVSGRGNTPYAALKKGGTLANYANTLAEVTAAQSLAAAAGMSYGVRAVAVIHGEADQIAGTLSYDQLLANWQSNYNADIKAITGQTIDIPLLMAQMSDWTSAGGGNSATGTIAYSILQAHTAQPGALVLVGPTYFLPVGADPHLTNAGYRQLGEYYGKVAQRVIGQGKSWRPLSPRKVQRSGKQILVTFWVPVQPLVIDTVTVTPPTANANGLNGFEWYDNSGSPPAVASVAVVAPTVVLVTLASAPTVAIGAGFLRYAYTGTAGNAPGAASGARGCLRDSDTSTSVYGYAMYNWCVHFNQAC